MEGNLKENGWFLSAEGIAECEKVCSKEKPTTTEYLKAAVNLDLRLFGIKHLPDDLNRGKIESIKGPVVLQIQKLKNTSAPQANEESNHAPRLLKFQLTDGHINCQGLEFSTIPDLSLGTPPGTKVCLIGTVPVQNGMLMLESSNTKVLGGEVEKLVTKWKLQKTLAKHSRTTPGGEEGPPPFVPFRQVKGSIENRGLGGTERSKVNCTIPNGLEKQNNHDNNEGKTRQQDNRGYRQTQQDTSIRRGRDQDRDRPTGNNPTRDERSDYRGDSRGNSGGGDFRGDTRNDFRGESRGDSRNDSRGEFRGDSRGDYRGDSKKTNQDRPYGRSQYDGRSNHRDDRDREFRGNGGNRNSEAQMGNNQEAERESRRGWSSEERGMSRRPEQSRGEKSERGSQEGAGRGGGGRGSVRGGRPGRREGAGRGRPDSAEQDEQEDYRARQPSDCGTLWDYLECKLPIKSTSKPTPPPTTTQQHCKELEREPEQSSNDTANNNIISHQESTEGEPPPPPKQQQEETQKRIRNDIPPANQQPREQKGRGDTERGRTGEKGGGTSESSHQTHRENRQQGPRQYQQRQQNVGQGRSRGQRGRHEDGRSHNQSLPPRLQKKQQQQYQQHHQQHFYNRDKSLSTEKELHRDKTSSPSSGSGGEGRSSQSPSVQSEESGQSKNSEDGGQSSPHTGHQKQQGRRQKGYQRQQQQAQNSVEYRSNSEQPQPSEQRLSQYEPQPTQTYVPNQQNISQPSYHMEQTHHYEMQAVREQPEPTQVIQQEYHYQQTTPPAPPIQQYPMYQIQPQMGPPQAAIASQQQMAAPPQHMQAQMAGAQIRWKKGDQCLALRRDGQFYSAKIEVVTPDGSHCMVSFQDFHGGCEMVLVASLRPFPIIAWTETSNAPQSLPATSITAVPVYAQPAPVAMVPRPQVMVPMPTQPHFSIGPRGPTPAPQPPGVQWQPAQMNYPDMRAQAYQPMVHYDPMPQTSNPAARPAFFAVPPGSTVQFVRGIKELHGQELYAHAEGMVDGSEAGKGIPSSTVFYNKPKKMNRPTQTFYMAPRQQKYREQSN